VCFREPVSSGGRSPLSLIWLTKCQGGTGSLHRVVHRFLLSREPQEVKRQVEGVISYPAVGMLIFASYLVVASQAGSPSFNSPRPCPHSRLGSRPASRRPITTSRVGHRTQSLHLMSALNVLSTGSSLLLAFLVVWVQRILTVRETRLCRSAT